MIKKIWKKLFRLKESPVDLIINDVKNFSQVFKSVTVPKEYLEVLESLYEACEPLTFDDDLTKEEVEDQIDSIRLMTYRCVNVIQKLQEEGKLP